MANSSSTATVNGQGRGWGMTLPHNGGPFTITDARWQKPNCAKQREILKTDKIVKNSRKFTSKHLGEQSEL